MSEEMSNDDESDSCENCVNDSNDRLCLEYLTKSGSDFFGEI